MIQANHPLCWMLSNSFLMLAFLRAQISAEKQISLVILCLLESDSLSALKSDKCNSLCLFCAACRRQIKRICLFLDTAELYKGLLFCNLFSRSDACVSNTPSRGEVWRSHPTWLWENVLQRCVGRWRQITEAASVRCQKTFRRGQPTHAVDSTAIWASQWPKMDCGFDFCRPPGQYPNVARSFFSWVLFLSFFL